MRAPRTLARDAAWYGPLSSRSGSRSMSSASRPVGRWSGGGGGRAVAVQGAAVGAGGGGGAVRVEGDGPAPPVDQDQVVEAAQQDAVSQAGGAVPAAGDDVVDVTGCRGLVAAGGGAVPVPGDDRAAQVRRDGVGDGADVQGQADRGGRGRQGPGAQPERQPGGAGQQRDRVVEDEPPGGGPVQFPAAAAGPAGAVRPAAPGPVVAAGAGPGRVGLGPPRRAAGPGEPGGQGVEEVVVDAAGHDRGDGGVAVIARPGRRAAGPPA